MPLLDHFRPPIHPVRPWESFLARWTTSIADALHGRMPQRYVADVVIRFDRSIEMDIADGEAGPPEPDDVSSNAPNDVELPPCILPKPPLTMSANFPDEVEVQVRDMLDDARLVAVVALISPGNLDRPDARAGFAGKCAAYLQKGIGLIFADIVTVRQFNLHNELIRLLGAGDQYLLSDDVYLYAVAYRPARRGEANQIDLWPVPLAVGGTLPLLPLALRGTRAVPVDLAKSYNDACERSRL
jgi:hypothetical protein